MSFGAAADRGSGARFPRPVDDAGCPCGSGARFAGCCAPVLRGTAAPTAERLMRSRYTAFVVGDVRHLLETWHPATRPEALELDPGQRWLGLEVIESRDGEEGDARGVVEFRARWRRGREHGVLHERSRFRRHDGRWRYLDAITPLAEPETSGSR